ncbi:unnamed protein product, partial [Brenthis ino]
MPISQQKSSNISSKVNKIAQDILANSSPSNREFVIKSVEKKLLKAAEHLGERGKTHVQLILEGIKLKISNFTKQRSLSNSLSIKNKDITSHNNNDDQIMNTQVADDLSNKIEKLIKTELDKLLTVESKQKLLDNIKRRVLEAVEEKLNLVRDVKPNSDTKGKGLLEYTDKVETDDSKHDIKIIDQIQSNAYFTENDLGSTRTLERFTAAPICNNVYEKVCSDIKDMNRLKCIYDEVFVSLDKLCDGHNDCADRSDEKYCGSQGIYRTDLVSFAAMERMEFSNKVINNMEHLLANNCFNIDKSSLAKRTHILRDVLQSQIDFKEKYLNFSSHMNKLSVKKESDSITSINRKAYEIAIIISSLAYALESAFCSQRSNDNESRRKNIFEKGLEEMIEEVTWPPKCVCIREHCHNCTDACKRICWHTYSLTKWKCESINGTGAISLNSLCDGKLDCFDESDENGCDTASGYTKFEAHEIYSNVLKMVNLKASKERSSTVKKLNLLRNLIIKLQKLTTKTEPNKTAIRKLRNKCYSLLKTIYLDILSQSSAASELGEAYLFLIAINQNLVSALKRSDTGNKRLITDECYCRNGSCGIPFCSKSCIKSCAVEPKLMKYDCKRSSNKTVTLDKICDEEICRRHHLIVLRNTVQDTGKHLEGTSLGELLNTWKNKVVSMIKVAEKDSRPKPKIFRNIVKNILKDLVTTYGSVEHYRRSNVEYALPDFLSIAQSIMETVKTCGK